MTEEESNSPFVEEMGDETLASPVAEPPQSEPASTAIPAATNEQAELGSRYEAEVRFLLFRLEKTEAAFADFKKQTGWFLLALLLFTCVSGIVIYLVANRAATQVTDLKPLVAATAKNSSFKVSSISFSHWEQGQPPVRLIRSSEGFCVLTKVIGHFQGGGESVRLWIDQDGYWYLGGESHQQDVGADCAVLRY